MRYKLQEELTNIRIIARYGESSVVYFIQDARTNAIKIGFTQGDSAEGRLASLQTGNSAELVLLATMRGGRDTEAELHQRFASFRLAGEWFNPAPPVLAEIIAQSIVSGMESGINGGLEHLQKIQKSLPYICLDDFGFDYGIAGQQHAPSRLLICPVCSGDYNHIGGVGPIHGYEQFRSTPIENDSIRWEGRGDGLAIRIWGECGHNWLLCLAFHKGQSAIFTAPNPEKCPFAEEAEESAF